MFESRYGLCTGQERLVTVFRYCFEISELILYRYCAYNVISAAEVVGFTCSQ
jgi:hypothetical protein